MFTSSLPLGLTLRTGFPFAGCSSLGSRKWFAIPAPGGPKENLFLIRTQGSFPPIRYTCVYTCLHFHMPRRGLSPYSLPLTAISEDVDVKLSSQLSPASCHEVDDAAYASRTFCDVQPPPILNATVSRLPSHDLLFYPSLPRAWQYSGFFSTLRRAAFSAPVTLGFYSTCLPFVVLSTRDDGRIEGVT